MGNTFNFKIELDGVNALADRIEKLSSGALLRLSAVQAVNEVITRFDSAARKGMNAGLNLSDDYIAGKMRVERAVDVPRAQIVTRGDLTVLGHFPHAQLTAPAPRGRKGDVRRGIAPGRKAAGVAVEITKGGASAQPKWFTMGLRVGNQAGDKTGIFVRTAQGIKHLYGPSPYSLFRFQINAHADELDDDLRRTATQRASDAIEKALS